jgi:hypothetical protein
VLPITSNEQKDKFRRLRQMLWLVAALRRAMLDAAFYKLLPQESSFYIFTLKAVGAIYVG